MTVSISSSPSTRSSVSGCKYPPRTTLNTPQECGCAPTRFAHPVTYQANTFAPAAIDAAPTMSRPACPASENVGLSSQKEFFIIQVSRARYWLAISYPIVFCRAMYPCIAKNQHDDNSKLVFVASFQHLGFQVGLNLGGCNSAL